MTPLPPNITCYVETRYEEMEECRKRKRDPPIDEARRCSICSVEGKVGLWDSKNPRCIWMGPASAEKLVPCVPRLSVASDPREDERRGDEIPKAAGLGSESSSWKKTSPACDKRADIQYRPNQKKKKTVKQKGEKIQKKTKNTIQFSAFTMQILPPLQVLRDEQTSSDFLLQ